MCLGVTHVITFHIAILYLYGVSSLLLLLYNATPYVGDPINGGK